MCNMTDSDVFIISAVRTAVGVGRPADPAQGKSGGALYPFHPVELASFVLKEAVRRAGVESARVEDVVWGVVTPIGDQGANLARLSALKAGFPVHVPAVTLNRMCGSSQQAVHFAAQSILSGDMDIVIAGGTEMMSHQSLGADYPREFPDVGHKLVHQGESAEMMADKWKLTRDELDDFAYQSHVRAARAIQAGEDDPQILPLDLPDGTKFTSDQGVRLQPDRAKMSALKPVFRENGVVTAGN
jgi:acetyl-CoA C-acetyltransferase